MQSTDKLCFNGKSDIAKIVSEQWLIHSSAIKWNVGSGKSIATNIGRTYGLWLQGANAMETMRLRKIHVPSRVERYSEDELAAYQPIIVLADEHNHPKPPHFRRG
jgi:hypothetical protein